MRDHYVSRVSTDVRIDGLWWDVVNEPTGAQVALVENEWLAERIARALNELEAREDGEP